MGRTLTAACLCALLIAGCGGGSAKNMADLQKANEDLTRRVKTLEDNLLESDKKLIQHQQAMQGLNERLRDVETKIQKIELGPR